MENRFFNNDGISVTSVEWIVLTKAPVAGKVKTRLIPMLGEQGACDIYCRLLKRLQQSLRSLVLKQGGHVALWIAGDDGHKEFKAWREFATFYQQPQQDDLAGMDLGGRMALAVKSTFSRGRFPILIGVDVPDLDELYLENCLQAFSTHDLVISPAEDGGYGLLGMKQFYGPLFESKSWGNGSVFSATKRDIECLDIYAAYLPKVWDVDEPEDVQRFNLMTNN